MGGETHRNQDPREVHMSLLPLEDKGALVRMEGTVSIAQVNDRQIRIDGIEDAPKDNDTIFHAILLLRIHLPRPMQGETRTGFVERGERVVVLCIGPGVD
jgi:hypothetical protein